MSKVLSLICEPSVANTVIDKRARYWWSVCYSYLNTKSGVLRGYAVSRWERSVGLGEGFRAGDKPREGG